MFWALVCESSLKGNFIQQVTARRAPNDREVVVIFNCMYKNTPPERVQPTNIISLVRELLVQFAVRSFH